MATRTSPAQLSDETLEALARSWDDAWSARDPERIVSHMTEDAVYEDPALPEVLRGRAAFKEQVENFIRALPDIELRQQTVFRSLEEPQRVGATHWTFEGTFRDTMLPQGYAPTGQRIRVEGMALVLLEGESVSGIRQYYDTTDFGRQIGAVPPKGSRGERFGILLQKLAARRMRRRG